MNGPHIEGTKSRDTWISTALRMDVLLANGEWYRVTAAELPNGGGIWHWRIRRHSDTNPSAEGDSKNERGARSAAVKAMRAIAAASTGVAS